MLSARPSHLVTCPTPRCHAVTGGGRCRRCGGSAAPLQTRLAVARHRAMLGLSESIRDLFQPMRGRRTQRGAGDVDLVVALATVGAALATGGWPLVLGGLLAAVVFDRRGPLAGALVTLGTVTATLLWWAFLQWRGG